MELASDSGDIVGAETFSAVEGAEGRAIAVTATTVHFAAQYRGSGVTFGSDPPAVNQTSGMRESYTYSYDDPGFPDPIATVSNNIELRYSPGTLVGMLAPAPPSEEEAAVTSTGAQLRILGGGRVVINPGGTLHLGD